MPKKLLTLPFLAAYLMAAGTAELDESNRVGSNLIVVHEYGSKKIFSKGDLVYDNKRTSKPVKDVEFFKTSPYQYSYFKPSADILPSEYVTTSFYFTGEGRISEGGIHSPIFKNKFNINNFVAYCDRYKIEDCVNMLNGFDVKNTLYIGIKNGTANTYGRDKGRFGQIKNKIQNAPLDEMTKAKALVKYEEMKNFLELAWEMPPSYYEDYLENSITPYMFMTNNKYVTSPIGKFADQKNIPVGIRSALPFFTNSLAVDDPKVAYEGDKKVFSFSREKNVRTGRGHSTPSTDIVKYDLSDANKSVAYFGISSASSLREPMAMYGVYTDGVKAGINGSIKAGTTVNRDASDLARGNFLLASKSETNSLDKVGNYIEFRDRQGGKISKLLAKNYLNAVRIYEVNYGVAAKPVRSGKEFAAVSTFTKSSDEYGMENFFDENSNKLAFISKINEYVNLNYENVDVKVKQFALHSEDSEGLYTEIDPTQKNSLDSIKRIENVGKYGDRLGSNRFTTGIDLTLFANMNDFVLGHNAYNNAVSRAEAYTRKSDGSPDELLKVSLSAIDSLQIRELDDSDDSGHVTNPSSGSGISGMERWLGNRYASPMSCMLDNECFMTLIKSAGVYNSLSSALDTQLMANDEKYPAQVNIKRTLQAVHTPGESGAYQFFGPKYSVAEQYQGIYESGDKNITWCANVYRPITNQLGFKERTDSFLRYKQTPEDNWFYLLPQAEAGANQKTALELSSGVAKIGRPAETIQLPNTIFDEKYEVGNSGSKFDYSTLVDVGGPMVTVGVGVCPDHSNETYSDDSLFMKIYPRPAWLHSQLSFRDAIEKYVDKFLAEDQHKVAICGGTESENHLDEIGMTCSGLLGELKSYMLNRFDTEAYLTMYEANYDLREKEKQIDPLNRFGLKYNMDDDYAVPQKKNAAAKENKLRDGARYLTELISNIYFKPYNTAKSPSSAVRQILLPGVPPSGISGSFDSNTTSHLNLCAKSQGYGARAATGSAPLERSSCFSGGFTGSVFGTGHTALTPPPAPTPTPTPPSGPVVTPSACAGKTIKYYLDRLYHNGASGASPTELFWYFPLPANKSIHIVNLRASCEFGGTIGTLRAGAGNGWKTQTGQNVQKGTPLSNITIKTTNANTNISLEGHITCAVSGVDPLDTGAYGDIKYCEVDSTPPPPPPPPPPPSPTPTPTPTPPPVVTPPAPPPAGPVFDCGKMNKFYIYTQEHTDEQGQNVSLVHTLGGDLFSKYVNKVTIKLKNGIQHSFTGGDFRFGYQSYGYNNRIHNVSMSMPNINSYPWVNWTDPFEVEFLTKQGKTVKAEAVIGGLLKPLSYYNSTYGGMFYEYGFSVTKCTQ